MLQNVVAQPVFPWLGGKRRLAKHLLPMFPDHACYVEPFCGAAALFFLRPAPAKKEVLNDINGDIINLYRVLQHHPEEFMRQFRWALSSRQIFEWLKDTPVATLTDIQQAARFYYVQQHAFGARPTGPSFGVDTSSLALNFTRIEERLSAAHLRLALATIEHLPWRACMERYDRQHTFFYCDPPYWRVAGYGVPFGWEEYEALAVFMGSCKGKVLLSINDHPDIRACFAGFKIRELSIKYSVSSTAAAKSKTSRELVISNW